VFSYHVLEQLSNHENHELAGIAAKGFKEVRYHVRHSSEWVLRFGDGTEESHNRAQSAVNELWRFTSEMFEADEIDRSVGPDLTAIARQWNEVVKDVLSRATLTIPNDPPAMTGGRKGRHTEHLGHMLSEMQIVARSHPNASW
jgi:ring-1,2-phenylacetyl-CoA epoxidase subunit PaaC